MRETVKQKLLKQCRLAMLAGIPIIYIKTDSSALIRELVLEEENPLVVLCSNTRNKRPYHEMRRKGTPCKPLNWADDILKLDSGIHVTTSQVTGEKTYAFPVIWTKKVTYDNLPVDFLEEYVRRHEALPDERDEALRASVVILYASEFCLPPSLRPYTEILDVPYPEEDEIRSLILKYTNSSLQLTENYLTRLCAAFSGYTGEEIRITLQKVAAQTSLEYSRKVERIILEQKKQKLQGGLLELCETGGDIGGLDDFQKWLREQSAPLKDHAVHRRMTGNKPPKGLLMCGIPGCGKSEAARFAARTLELPLLRLDMGRVMDKYQGESERKMREATALAEAVSPCILWIDELEKAFDSVKGDSQGSDASFHRMFSYLLSWMQDYEKPVFLFATANRIGGLPKEFFRSGRFERLFAVYLPTAAECARIFVSCMRRAERSAGEARWPGGERDAVLFSGSRSGKTLCWDEDLYRRFMTEYMVRDGHPRIVVGSDIQKLVSTAFRELMADGQIGENEPLTQEAWLEALKRALRTCEVYGESYENLFSIAVSYCRLLRNRFVPATEKVLIRTEDYCGGIAVELAELLDAERDPEQRRAIRKKLPVLKSRALPAEDSYDQAVYACLTEQINKVAMQVELYENKLMIGG